MTTPTDDGPRDLITAIAIAHQIGFARGHRRDPDGLYEDDWLTAWRDVPWEDQMNNINEAAMALDKVVETSTDPVPNEFWAKYDWYLTIDEVAASVIRAATGDSNLEWDELTWGPERVSHCLILYETEPVGKGEGEAGNG